MDSSDSQKQGRGASAGTTHFRFSLTYGWLGQPHRNRYQRFDSLAEARTFRAKWLTGGNERCAEPVKRVSL